MTKQRAFEDFKTCYEPIIIEQYGPDDKIARREAWNHYTDTLCKDRTITQRQYETWTNPF